MDDARDGPLPILRLGAPLYGRHRSQVRQWARTRPSASYAHLAKEQEHVYLAGSPLWEKPNPNGPHGSARMVHPPPCEVVDWAPLWRIHITQVAQQRWPADLISQDQTRPRLVRRHDERVVGMSPLHSPDKPR
ncbi:putative beta-galactosidase B [Fusarium oxysporum f. sp. albedinis]|nr:putative beta-galactosidase B [Fusarium oxysporum f. sp. albedinis]